ncbi:Hint domain-containing protein [Sphingomonas sp. R86521]|uniref:Hint domain-containing protein n=1 Tax=Sphingomonas sp. R86521 TaxID=3093860 RepID=UPI0036D27017
MAQFTWNYTFPDGNVSFVVENAGNNTYTIVSATGTVAGNYTVTGLGTTHAPDNTLYSDTRHSFDYGFSNQGVSLTVSDGTPGSAGYQYHLSPVSVFTQLPSGGFSVQTQIEGTVYDARDNSVSVNTSVPVYTNNVPPPCFVSGTGILTTSGEVLVEDLQVGDVVVTAAGNEVPVQWIGSHAVRCDRCFDPTSAWPIRISANAFGEMKPHRDLYLSPGHAVWVPFMDEGVLIPALSLVNGATVAQIETDEVTYWHIELATHDILLANGLPAESYIDVDNRSFFQSTEGYLPPDRAPRTFDDYCRPFFAEGYVVDAVHKALRDKAFAMGWTLEIATDPNLQLSADGKIIEPAFYNNQARFIVPANAKDVWLLSETSVPYHVLGSSDRRSLGIQLEAISIDDGLSVQRDIALDDDLLCVGFHGIETEDTWRWTAGKSRLPAKLWEGCKDIAIFRISFAAPCLPRWAPPQRPKADVEDVFRLASAA